MGWWEAMIYRKRKNRRMSFPLMSYERLELEYYNKTNFGTAAMYMVQDPPPIQMTLRMLRV